MPFSEIEDVFETVSPASDGQYKVQVFIQPDALELYIPTAGRFNVEGYVGWTQLEWATKQSVQQVPEMSHAQVQTLLGAIGAARALHVWIPPADRCGLDWGLARKYALLKKLPLSSGVTLDILRQIDVVWMRKGTTAPAALFEVEHSTPVYTGLLRFNDIHLSMPHVDAKFSIVANDSRRSLFSRQIRRPTFQSSGLSDLCSFLRYDDVYAWHTRVCRRDDACQQGG